MSAANTCDCACPTPTVSEVPGSAGLDGADGAAGAAGVSSFTTTTSLFTVPPVGNDVLVFVASSEWMVTGQVVFITGAGYFEVASTPVFPFESVSLTYLAYDANINSGSVIAGGTGVSVGGLQFTVPVSAANGGTGLATLTAFGVLVGNGVGVAHVTAAGAANTFLAGAGAANPIYRAVNIASADVTGTLPVANGGTGGATAILARAALGVGGASLSVYAAGTAYQLTNTSALLNFGTTDPSLVITSAGTWLLLARARIDYTAATFAASQTATLKLRRTNNTAADITNSPASVLTDIITTLTYTLGVVNLQPIIYTTANVNDVLELWGSVGVVPSAGSLDAVEASIVAIQLFI